MGLRLSKLPKVAEGDKWVIPWLLIDDYEDLVYVNGAFVAGRLSRSPYRTNPWVKFQSAPKAIPKLITLQRYGLVTTQYQPASIVENQTATTPDGKEYYYSQRRRPYVVFFTPKTTRKMDAVMAMFNSPDLYAVWISDSDTKKTRTNFSGDIVLDESKRASSITALDRESYREGARLSSDLPFQTAAIFDWLPNVYEALRNTVCVTVVSTLPFGEGDVLDDLHTQLVLTHNKQMYDVK